MYPIVFYLSIRVFAQSQMVYNNFRPTLSHLTTCLTFSFLYNDHIHQYFFFLTKSDVQIMRLMYINIVANNIKLKREREHGQNAEVESGWCQLHSPLARAKLAPTYGTHYPKQASTNHFLVLFLFLFLFVLPQIISIFIRS